MSTIWGYVRVSTMRQKLQRQIDNIKERYPEAVIITESFTGTSMDRPSWNGLMKKVKEGDTIVFDEISRMGRDATEGFKTYKALFDRGVNLVFLKEPTLDTDCFRTALNTQIEMTGNELADIYIEATNRALMLLAEKQIKVALETAEHEVDFLHKRISEGLRQAQVSGKRVGTQKGDTFTTKKSVEAKAIILKHAKEFGGSLTDKELIEMTHLSRNTFYKYKRELKANNE